MTQPQSCTVGTQCCCWWPLTREGRIWPLMCSPAPESWSSVNSGKRVSKLCNKCQAFVYTHTQAGSENADLLKMLLYCKTLQIFFTFLFHLKISDINVKNWSSVISPPRFSWSRHDDWSWGTLDIRSQHETSVQHQLVHSVQSPVTIHLLMRCYVWR